MACFLLSAWFTPFWAASLKLVRRWDPADIFLPLRWDDSFQKISVWHLAICSFRIPIPALVLFLFLWCRLLLILIIWPKKNSLNRNGIVLSGTIWTSETVELAIPKFLAHRILFFFDSRTEYYMPLNYARNGVALSTHQKKNYQRSCQWCYGSRWQWIWRQQRIWPNQFQ